MWVSPPNPTYRRTKMIRALVLVFSKPKVLTAAVTLIETTLDSLADGEISQEERNRLTERFWDFIKEARS